MELSKDRQKETGAFYTPKEWAELAVKYISLEVGNLNNFVFYDPACGEGDLLEALPKEVRKFGTTLESEDVRICREKGLTVFQYDFLQEDKENECFPLECYLEGIKRPYELIVFTNPPYFKLKKDQYPTIKKRFGTNDSVALFYYRIFEDVNPLYLCGFNKIDLYQSQKMKNFRDETDFACRMVSGFMTHSKTWNLKGRFPIVFNIIGHHSFFDTDNYQNVYFDVFEEKPFKYKIPCY